MRRDDKPLRIAIALLLLSLPLYPGNRAQETEYLQRPDLTGARGGKLVVAVDADPPTFNRMLTTGLAHATVVDRLSADLVHINRLTFELEPSLASHWAVSQDGRTYTVHLRKGLRFSDGAPCDADDVIFTFEAMQDPKTGSVLADQLRIDGAFPKISKMDAHTLRIVFTRPVGMGLRAFDSVPILPRRHLLEAYQAGRFASAMGPTANPGEVVGMGPFRLKEYERGVKIVMERNPYYWKRDRTGQVLPYLDTITFLIIADRNSEALRFQAGELDLLNSLDVENYAGLRRAQGQANYAVHDLGPGLYMEFLWFNLNPGRDGSGKPLVDVEKQALFERREFRQAVSQALDREGMIGSILLRRGTAQFGPISSGNKVWFNPAISASPRDPARSRALLSRLGLTDADRDGIVEFGAARRPLEISLLTARGNARREKMAQIIRQNLAEIGIAVDIQSFQVNELLSRILNSYSYESALLGFNVTDVVPDLQTDLWYSNGKNHFWHPAQTEPRRPWEREIDTLTSRLVSSMDPGERLQAVNRIQKIWAGELPAIPTVSPNVLVAWNFRVGNVRPSILGPQLLWNAEELTAGPR